jgi:uncharacterized protein
MILVSLLILVVICAVGLLGSAWLLGSSLIQQDNHPVSMPADFPVQPVSIPGAGRAIAGSWSDNGARSPVVLLLHAVRADRTSMVPRARLLARHGFSVLLIDLQGHGETPGAAITLGARESADVAASLAWIKQKMPGRRVGAIGCSLGGAALLLAPQPGGFDAVVVEGVYARISHAVENRIQLRLGVLAPIFVPLLIMQMKPRLHVRARDLEPIRFIARVGAPILVAGGTADEHTTLAETQELYDAASVPKELWAVKGAEHEDLLEFDARGYEQRVVRFLTDNLAPDLTRERP